MKNIIKIAAVIVSMLPLAHSATLTNGTLRVDIRNDNGAIDTVSFGGTDYFNPGIPVSDWGFQSLPAAPPPDMNKKFPGYAWGIRLPEIRNHPMALPLPSSYSFPR